MICFNVLSVSHGLTRGLNHLSWSGVLSKSRNGDVIVSREPVVTTYLYPANRVLLSPMRDANPFFHVMEALWMLAGRNDLSWIRLFNRRFKEYSDDGKTLHGAYGHRWRNHFGRDQLSDIAAGLRQKSDDRRMVLSMWDPAVDLGRSGVDFPCNTHAYFDTLNDGRLNMTVSCRSNDIWWGCYGANAVHFSFLLEYMAAATGLEMGVYRQMSNNYHIYPGIVNINHGTILDSLCKDILDHDPFTEGVVPQVYLNRNFDLKKAPLVDNPETFMEELDWFMADSALSEQNYQNKFFPRVAVPMFRAWACYKNNLHQGAFTSAQDIEDGAWMLACVQWLERRALARQMKKATVHDTD